MLASHLVPEEARLKEIQFPLSQPFDPEHLPIFVEQTAIKEWDPYGVNKDRQTCVNFVKLVFLSETIDR